MQGLDMLVWMVLMVFPDAGELPLSSQDARFDDLEVNRMEERCGR